MHRVIGRNSPIRTKWPVLGGVLADEKAALYLKFAEELRLGHR